MKDIDNQVDDEIVLNISDKNFSEFQKIDLNGPSPIKKSTGDAKNTPGNDKSGKTKKLKSGKTKAPEAPAKEEGKSKLTEQEKSPQKKLTEKTAEAKTAANKRPPANVKTENEAIKSTPLKKKKKLKVSKDSQENTESDKSSTGAVVKKKKKKLVSVGTGLRKGRSGANTRSTNLHL